MGLRGEGGGVARLQAGDRACVLAHLLALGRDDRYGRFASPLSDAGIAAYGDRIDFGRDLCFATREPDRRISGFLHLAVHGEAAELGASVLPPWRQQGKARQLFRVALETAAAAGIGEIHLATGHPVARRICAGLGLPMREQCGYPRVVVALLQAGGDPWV